MTGRVVIWGKGRYAAIVSTSRIVIASIIVTRSLSGRRSIAIANLLDCLQKVPDTVIIVIAVSIIRQPHHYARTCVDCMTLGGGRGWAHVVSVGVAHRCCAVKLHASLASACVVAQAVSALCGVLSTVAPCT